METAATTTEGTTTVNTMLLPTAAALAALPTIFECQDSDLKVDTDDFRLWLSRCDLSDGEPFDRTVYVEMFDGVLGWVLLGYYDGDDPVDGLPGVTAHAFRGEAPEPVQCVRCGAVLTGDDPAVTTLGARCRRCW